MHRPVVAAEPVYGHRPAEGLRHGAALHGRLTDARVVDTLGDDEGHATGVVRLQLGGELRADGVDDAGADDLGLPVDAQRQGHHLRPRGGVDRCPWLGPVSQQSELDRQPTLRDAGVDAVGVGREQSVGLDRQQAGLTLGGVAQRQGAHPPVQRERHLAQQLGDTSRDDAPVDLHLPQPVLRVQVPLGAGNVLCRLAEDVRDAPRVDDNLDWS